MQLALSENGFDTRQSRGRPRRMGPIAVGWLSLGSVSSPCGFPPPAEERILRSYEEYDEDDRYQLCSCLRAAIGWQRGRTTNKQRTSQPDAVELQRGRLLRRQHQLG